VSESVNEIGVAGEILRLAKLACAVGENPVATPSDFRHVLLGNRLQASPSPATDLLIRFTVPADSIWVLTWIFLRSIPTPALDGLGAFDPLGQDWRSNQDLTVYGSGIVGQGASWVILEVNGQPVTPNGSIGIRSQQICNRPILLTFRSQEQVALRVDVNGPAVPIIDLVGVVNSYLVPVHIGQCLAKLASGLGYCGGGGGGDSDCV